MITVLSSPKPGSGTSTTAALLALAASNDTPTTLVDLCGDQPALLNCPVIDGDIHIDDRLTLHNATDAALDQQLAVIQAIDPGRHIVIDAGPTTHPIFEVLPARTVHYWVVRQCYLALRRAITRSERPDGVFMLAEPGRSLTANDISCALGVPVVATLDVHPDIARLVDAGLLSGRPPRHALRRLTDVLRIEETQT